MISWLSNWAQGIIVAVIIAIIVEMILPQSSLKKYVKVVIGIYIVFTIIAPIIAKLSNGKMDFNEMFNTSVYAKELEESDSNVAKKIDSNNSKTIKDIFIDNLKNDVKSKLKTKGYNTVNLYINAKDDQNYTIEEMDLSLEKAKQEDDKQNDNISSINKVTIQMNDISSNAINDNTNEKLLDSDKDTVKEYLSNEYGINKNNILIN